MSAGAGRHAPKPERATLRRQLLISLLAPIVVVTLISAVVTYYYAFNFATLAYDYSLFDSALDISRQTRVVDSKLQVDLPSAALDMLESDTHDRIYYLVSDAQRAFIAGHRGLPAPAEDAPPGKPVYYDGNYRGSGPDQCLPFDGAQAFGSESCRQRRRSSRDCLHRSHEGDGGDAVQCHHV